jgi:hypothetical protein
MISAGIHTPWDDFSGLNVNAGVRERLHEEFDVWLNMLEEEMSGKEGRSLTAGGNSHDCPILSSLIAIYHRHLAFITKE